MSNVVRLKLKQALSPEEERWLRLLNEFEQLQKKVDAIRARYKIPLLDEASLDARLRRMGMLD